MLRKLLQPLARRKAALSGIGSLLLHCYTEHLEAVT